MPQIKVTIDDKIYKQLKRAAKDNFRTITNEINYRLQQSFTTPAPTPTLTPTYIPHGVPGGIPVEPYKITSLSADTTPQPVKTKKEILREKHPEWFNSNGKRKVIGIEDEEEETGENTAATTTQTGEPIGTVYKSNHTPQLTITDDDFDEPEPEWDADRGGARP